MVPIDKAGATVIAGVDLHRNASTTRNIIGRLVEAWKNGHRALRTYTGEMKTVEGDRQWVKQEGYFRSENCFQMIFAFWRL